MAKFVLHFVAAFSRQKLTFATHFKPLYFTAFAPSTFKPPNGMNVNSQAQVAYSQREAPHSYRRCKPFGNQEP